MLDSQPSEFEKTLLSLLEKQEGLEARLSELEFDVLDSVGLSIRYLYPAFRDGVPSMTDLAKFLALRIVSYCLPRSERKRALDKANKSGADVQAITQLVHKARRLFMKAEEHLSRSGEAGEVLLYSLIEHHLKSPLVVAKMLLKTNTEMPVHGTDGIHARYDSVEKKLILIFGESKIHKSFSSAIGSAIESMHHFVTNPNVESHEIQLIVDHADLDLLTDEQRQSFLTFLDPYNKNSNDRIQRIACLLGFDQATFSAIVAKPRSEREKEFKSICSEDIKKKLATIKEKLDSKALDTARIDFFLIPFPSVEDFRELFKESLYG